MDDSLIKKDEVLKTAEIFVKSGIKIFQYRAKNTSVEDILSISYSLSKLAQNYQVKLIINDYVEIALKVRAAGVHLGQNDITLKEARRILGQNRIVGISTHTLGEARIAQAEGSDYISIGPIFKTHTKKDTYLIRGTKFLKKIVSNVNLPVIAIGGINKKNINRVLKSGADGVALISEIYKSPDLLSNLLVLMKLAKRIKEEINKDDSNRES
ncbi:MAG: thiamine phosphate synthase [bacterium]|nr:thiamine phosphate synthase [bacterium]